MKKNRDWEQIAVIAFLLSIFILFAACLIVAFIIKYS